MYRHRSFGSGAIHFPRNEPVHMKNLAFLSFSCALACSGRSRGERASAAATTTQPGGPGPISTSPPFVAAAVCNLVVDVSLIKFIGLYAASGSSLISYLLLFIYRLLDIQKIVKVKYKWSHLLPVFCVLVIECALCFQRNMVLDFINLVFSILFFFFLK